MSIKLMSQVWDNGDPELKGSKLVVLLCLADHANDDGVCWPSIKRIAERARINRRSAMRQIQELETIGYLTVKRKRGSHNVYVVYATRDTRDTYVTSDAHVTPTSDAHVTPTSDAHVTPLVTPMSPEPSINHQQREPSIESSPDHHSDPISKNTSRNDGKEPTAPPEAKSEFEIALQKEFGDGVLGKALSQAEIALSDDDMVTIYCAPSDRFYLSQVATRNQLGRAVTKVLGHRAAIQVTTGDSK